MPIWFRATRAIEQRDAAQRVVRLGQLENTLAAALIDVQRGEFEPARQRTNDFYTNLRRQVDAVDTSVFTPFQRERLRSLLVERDELINLLARSDPAAKDRRFSVYAYYHKTLNKRRLLNRKPALTWYFWLSERSPFAINLDRKASQASLVH